MKGLLSRKINKPVMLAEKKDGIYPYILLAPSILILLAVIVFPIFMSLYMSLNEVRVIAGGIKYTFKGLENYLYFFKNPLFWESLRVTTYFTVVSLVIELILGFFMASILNREFWGRNIVRSLILIPWAVPTVVNARIWQWIYNANDFGALNRILKGLNIIKENVVWLREVTPFAGSLMAKFFEWCGASRALHMIIIGDTWKVTPLVALLLLAGMQTIPDSFYEAADVDGANWWQKFKYITLPRLKPVLLVILVLRTMELFRVFDILYIIMSYQVKVLSILTYENGFVFLKFGRAAALSFIIGTIIMALAFVYMKFLYVEEGDE
ncbi:carbohydrate ABC transporter permease [Halothermothrix orenii]|uniref:Binding-protein-dependent transport systems inner membrane component n=1 Tax=Halothermothrix orenii (strain H 168 / OCM 544 / DSM 9562) TaxID=373903 RepID=B8CZL6_HALOH|nr:sugar ABC transporter permease [Halothermothrix orenii]ACL70735.1 binding-protein-dependent transport systems inner membrane component [Halothermothrix orenii H 168]